MGILKLYFDLWMISGLCSHLLDLVSLVALFKWYVKTDKTCRKWVPTVAERGGEEALKVLQRHGLTSLC